MTLHMFLFILAFVCFVVAAVPHKFNIKFEWLGVAALVLTKIL